ncbi:MAG: hypothetical protein R3E57_07700 [Porticoccaceae bacterium]
MVATYLLSCPRGNMAGLYHIPIRSIAKDVLLDESVVSSAIDSLEEIGFCKYDSSDEYCWVCGAALEELGDNPSRQQLRGLQNLINRLILDEGAPFAEELEALVFSNPEFRAKLIEEAKPPGQAPPKIINAVSTFQSGTRVQAKGTG